jgi:hypothetical protein
MMVQLRQHQDEMSWAESTARNLVELQDRTVGQQNSATPFETTFTPRVSQTSHCLTSTTRIGILHRPTTTQTQKPPLFRTYRVESTVYSR